MSALKDKFQKWFAPKKPVEEDIPSLVENVDFNFQWENAFEGLGLPIESELDFPNLEEKDRAFFQLCCELYRIIDLLDRRKDFLLNVFSEYRTREQFESVLKFRYFECHLSDVSQWDPKLATLLLGGFNFIHELRISLKHTNGLPSAVRQEVNWADTKLKRTWNHLADAIHLKHGWPLTQFELGK